ncbi:MAG: NAD-dependent epimerase/dehydratase family protein [Chloroflexales bacterium]|nr:NAD-dependent epimerase/dehydratase family protein [Chloroflexales bacterium]
MTNQQRVLITGGAGFLGINLVRFLQPKGYRLTTLDLAPFSYADTQAHVAHVSGDIRDVRLVDQVMRDQDIVIHAAAALPLYTPRDIYTTDVEGTRTILEAARQHHARRVVHISSTAVYGVPDHHPLYETDRLSGVGPYGQAKIQAEMVCLEYRAKGLVVPILRPKTFIGPERLGVFDILFDWALDGRNFPLIGSGKNRYQFLHVADLCQAIDLCMSQPSEAVNDTFNIGAKVFGMMRADYQAVLDTAGFGKRVIPLPASPVIAGLRFLEALRLSPLYQWVYDTAGKDSFVSIEKAERQLGFAPQYSNVDALLGNFHWYRENRHTFATQSGISHRVPWKQGVLRFAKRLF